MKINYMLIPFPLEKSYKNEQTINSHSRLKAVSTLTHMCKNPLILGKKAPFQFLKPLYSCN